MVLAALHAPAAHALAIHPDGQAHHSPCFSSDTQRRGWRLGAIAQRARAHHQAGTQHPQHLQDLLQAHRARLGLDLDHARPADAEQRAQLRLRGVRMLAQRFELWAELFGQGEGNPWAVLLAHSCIVNKQAWSKFCQIQVKTNTALTAPQPPH